MIEATSFESLAVAVRDCVKADRQILEQLREDVRNLRARTKRIHPRSATAISLVGTDGGNNQIRFDPFMVQLVRVVDSSRNEYCLEAITPRSKLDALDKRHFDSSGRPMSPLGRMMEYLGVSGLQDLSPVFGPDEERSPSWVLVYREMMEWAVLFSLVRDHDFGTDTVIVCDGLLRSKMFSGRLFAKYRAGLEEGIRRQFETSRRRIYLAGIAKHSKVLQTYRLALALEGVLRNAYPSYVEVPRELEAKVYAWSEYAAVGAEGSKFVAGKMFFVKFGAGQHDPIWALDLFIPQTQDAAVVLGYLLADALDGFPVPFYPQCLQRAHEAAALVEFDLEILQDQVCAALRDQLAGKGWLIDEFALQEADPSHYRY